MRGGGPFPFVVREFFLVPTMVGPCDPLTEYCPLMEDLLKMKKRRINFVNTAEPHTNATHYNAIMDITLSGNLDPMSSIMNKQQRNFHAHAIYYKCYAFYAPQ